MDVLSVKIRPILYLVLTEFYWMEHIFDYSCKKEKEQTVGNGKKTCQTQHILGQVWGDPCESINPFLKFPTFNTIFIL